MKVNTCEILNGKEQKSIKGHFRWTPLEEEATERSFWFPTHGNGSEAGWEDQGSRLKHPCAGQPRTYPLPFPGLSVPFG